ncbi:MAG: hypothetical protein DRJ52_02825 [Thermoprotei archaeon]|nr:MAG: hypothetical protein DRJ52_02825 [Thermoprotei archaeon]RLF00189.1 MAG: hypothetical protein DRJ63_03180 [Thermoprotei archaeon]
MKLSVLMDIDQVIVERNPLSYVIRDLAELLFRRKGISREVFLNEIRRKRIARIKSGDYMGAYNYQDIIEKVYRKLGLREEVPILSELLKDYLREDYLKIYIDALEAIKLLKKMPVALIAFSSGYSEYQVPLLDKIGLLKYFDKIATPDILGYGKPDRRAYMRALEGMPSSALAVGDSLFFDVYGAKNAGIPAVLVVREKFSSIDDFLKAKYIREKISLEIDYPFQRPDYIITSMLDLPCIVESLL